MTYYCRITPYLVASTTPDYSSNQLPPPDSEALTATKVLEASTTVPANYASAVYWNLSSWATIDSILVVNTGTNTIEVDWQSPWTDGTNSGAIKTFAFVPPGRSITIPSAEPTDDLYGDGSVPGSIAIWGVHLTVDGAASITVLGT